MKSPLIELLSTAALSSALIAALVWLARTWIFERLSRSIRHEYDRNIEAYKSAVSSVVAAAAEGQRASIEKRLQAFDRLWKALLAIRDKTGPALLYIDITTIDEYESGQTGPSLSGILKKLDDREIQGMDVDKTIEEVRPYVGEIVWSLFTVYRAFCIRIIFLAQQDFTKTSANKHWTKDAGIRSLLETVLSREDFRKVEGRTISKVDFVRNAIEGKVLDAWRSLLSGRDYGKEALEHAREILDASNRLGRGS